MRDFAIDNDGTFMREYNGLRMTSTLTEYVAQKLQIKFRFFLGEWYLDTSKGIPYLTKILGKNIDIAFVESIYKSAILSLDEVEELRSFSLEIDAVTRTLTVTFSVKLVDSDSTETITIEV